MNKTSEYLSSTSTLEKPIQNFDICQVQMSLGVRATRNVGTIQNLKYVFHISCSKSKRANLSEAERNIPPRLLKESLPCSLSDFPFPHFPSPSQTQQGECQHQTAGKHGSYSIFDLNASLPSQACFENVAPWTRDASPNAGNSL